MTWTVRSRVECLHEPEFPGDKATFVDLWFIEKNANAHGCDDSDGPFDTEAEARECANSLNEYEASLTFEDKARRWAWPDGRPEP